MKILLQAVSRPQWIDKIRGAPFTYGWPYNLFGCVSVTAADRSSGHVTRVETLHSRASFIGYILLCSFTSSDILRPTLVRVSERRKAIVLLEQDFRFETFQNHLDNTSPPNDLVRQVCAPRKSTAMPSRIKHAPFRSRIPQFIFATSCDTTSPRAYHLSLPLLVTSKLAANERIQKRGVFARAGCIAILLSMALPTSGERRSEHA